MIKVENLIFDYPNKRVLKDLSFDINPGSVTALVGPNGAGKTTLLRCISGLLPIYEGHIFVNNIDVNKSPRVVHRTLGYLSDFFGVYNDLTVQQCLEFNARIHNIPNSEIDTKIALAVQRVSLNDYLNTQASELSRGLRQRLGIAQTIIHEPKVLLLDEPASGLDPEARIQLSELILSLRDQGTTIIVSSHIISELEDYCSDMLMIRNGEIISHTTKETTTSNKEKFVATIILSEPAEQYKTVLDKIPELENLTFNNTEIRCNFTGHEHTQQSILKQLIELNIPVCSFTINKKRLKDIYMDNR